MRLTMTALRNAMIRIRAFLDVMDAAMSASAAVRLHHAPAVADLRRLGIEPTRAAMAALSRA
ncbi:hypothetical protein GIY56_13210 [Paracoccus sp. YIM 132242]|uniref:Uncharacterized protein n=1 Tax=Paracoccus lichenicola TaxID=2665644 RepID=A0A6L6HSG1_9RHOB|nr:hypothetical protein [Paracoccus lichenicola]MTE01242.1 hypothetical protein [Paracoccus lichenicola]